MDYAALKAEAALPAYAGMTDAQVAAALNTANVAAFVDVDPRDVYEILLNSGEWGRIELFSRLVPTGTLATPSAQDGNVARLVTFVRACTAPVTLRTSRAAVRSTFGSILTALVSGGFIAAATQTAINALASATITRAAQLGLGTVAPGDVATARATV